jgi:platelet-activating factor acetylhydrolase
MPALKYSPLSKDPSLPAKLPVIIFCHGLKGNQTTYSYFVGNLASRGFVVLSLEHRDFSASVTATGSFQNVMRYKDPEKHTNVKNSKLPNESQDQFLLRFRKQQMEIRVKEVQEAVTVLKQLANGSQIKNLLNHWLPNFKDRMDLDNIIISGHSFGGATGLVCLQSMPDVFKCGIILE